jgi:hypothetical protein
MSVLLRNMETAKYLENPSEWTEHPDQARKFGGAMDALFYCCKHQLRNVEIQGGDFRIPLRNLAVDQADRLSE